MKIKWQRLWARKFSLYLGSQFLQVFLRPGRFGRVPNKLFVPEGKLYAIYFAADEFRRLVKNYRRFLFRCNLSSYARHYEGEFQQFFAWAKTVSRRNLRVMPAAAFARLFAELSQHLIDFAELQFLAFVVLEGPGRELEEAMAQRPDGGRLLQAVTATYRQTIIARARVELLQLVAAKKTATRHLSAYVQRYAWLPVYEFIDAPLTIDEVRKQVQRIRDAAGELRQYRQHRRQSLREYQGLLASIRAPKLRRLVQIVHAWSYLKEMRDDYRRHAYYLLIPFWREVARRTKLPFALTNCCTADELIAALQIGRMPSRSVLVSRQRHYAVRLREGRLFVYRGRQADLVARLVAARFAGRELHGASACPGKVRGRARIIFHRGEFKKFRPGDILVTTKTHPEFVPLMQQAAAIVTDEGGLTCHAAIVAREMKKPCVIGTKIATKVFKDGDRVEVDAERGMVRKV